jgi:hypothetical protein
MGTKNKGCTGLTMIKENLTVTTVYFDESGFSGSNLLDPNQKTFVYAGVRISPPDACALIQEARNRFGLQKGELKGKNLVKNARGIDVLTFIAKECIGNCQILLFNKEYALSCFFFEYIVEPTIASKNSLFYRVGFHKFFATVLYIHFVARNLDAIGLMTRFESCIRSGDLESFIKELRGIVVNSEPDSFLGQVADFVESNSSAIIPEAKSAHGYGINPWILDLTTTALFSLLSHFAENNDSMTVFCDSSKPLRAYMDLFTAMVGREDTHFIRFDGRKRRIVFNLDVVPRLVDSQSHPGVQLADAMASAARYCAQNHDADGLEELKDSLDMCMSPDSNVPDAAHMDLTEPLPIANAMLWHELCDRSDRGADMLNGIEYFL